MKIIKEDERTFISFTREEMEEVDALEALEELRKKLSAHAQKYLLKIVQSPLEALPPADPELRARLKLARYQHQKKREPLSENIETGLEIDKAHKKGKSWAQAGRPYGLSREAARKRANRAVEYMQEHGGMD